VASDTTVSESGTLVVYKGGKAIGTVINQNTGTSDGGMFVSSGGTARATTVNSGGIALVFDGGVNSGARVSGGGTLQVSSGGTLSGLTVVDGGSVVLDAGAIANDSFDFVGSGVLIIDGSAMPSAVISGF